MGSRKLARCSRQRWDFWWRCVVLSWPPSTISLLAHSPPPHLPLPSPHTCCTRHCRPIQGAHSHTWHPSNWSRGGLRGCAVSFWLLRPFTHTFILTTSPPFAPLAECLAVCLWSSRTCMALALIAWPGIGVSSLLLCRSEPWREEWESWGLWDAAYPPIRRSRSQKKGVNKGEGTSESQSTAGLGTSPARAGSARILLLLLHLPPLLTAIASWLQNDDVVQRVAIAALALQES